MEISWIFATISASGWKEDVHSASAKREVSCAGYGSRCYFKVIRIVGDMAQRDKCLWNQDPSLEVTVDGLFSFLAKSRGDGF